MCIRDSVSGNTLINVVIEDQPTFDLSSEICTKNTQPTLINNVWTLGWTVTQMTADQITQTNQTEALNIRSLRNSKLTACDWTQSPDNPMASATKTAWATYRQALRDLTKETGFPWNVTWPTDPNGNI